MKLVKITKFLVKATGRSGLVLRKHSPEIFLAIGIVGIVGSAVLACRATYLHANEILEKRNAGFEAVKECLDGVEAGTIAPEDYTEKDKGKDILTIYVQTGVAYFKLYAPSVILGIISLGFIVGSHGILKGRNVALMAAYKTISEGFAAYRKRNIEDQGEDVDFAYRNGLTAEKVVTSEKGEDGKVHKVTKTNFAGDANKHSVYARFFDESCSQWSKNAEYNLMCLRSQQNYYNDMLQARGHVFLNEVYDALGIPRTEAGAVVGWVISKDSDNAIDFGIFNAESASARSFVNGYERSILLDFNVDGVIYDLI